MLELIDPDRNDARGRTHRLIAQIVAQPLLALVIVFGCPLAILRCNARALEPGGPSS